jgi:hypothetical protein
LILSSVVVGVVMNGLGWKRRQYRYGFGFGERERKLMEGGECPDVCVRRVSVEERGKEERDQRSVRNTRAVIH